MVGTYGAALESVLCPTLNLTVLGTHPCGPLVSLVTQVSVVTVLWGQEVVLTKSTVGEGTEHSKVPGPVAQTMEQAGLPPLELVWSQQQESADETGTGVGTAGPTSELPEALHRMPASWRRWRTPSMDQSPPEKVLLLLLQVP